MKRIQIAKDLDLLPTDFETLPETEVASQIFRNATEKNKVAELWDSTIGNDILNPYRKSSVRVRVAPSPTGDPHVGTAYIALFNYVFAKSQSGTFLVRIEDTDQKRCSPESEQAILDALTWLGFSSDEPVLRQSERLSIYKRHAQILLDSGHAYKCFCTKERLDGLPAPTNGRERGYDGHCKTLDANLASKLEAEGTPFVIRFRTPGGTVVVPEGLRGDLSFETFVNDDPILIKSDGWPTYHLASVVDDHDTCISHVIRGEEWIVSTPLHLQLYASFGWTPPQFYHLGLLRNTDKSKLSKRKNPVSILHYRDMGYFPETFLNFLGTLGFSFGNNRERFTLDEMIKVFDWKKVGTSGPVFDVVKLQAFNTDDLRKMDPQDLLNRFLVSNNQRLKGLLTEAMPRIQTMEDFIPLMSSFFGGTIDLDLSKLEIKGLLPKANPFVVPAAILNAFPFPFHEARAQQLRQRLIEKFPTGAAARQLLEQIGADTSTVFFEQPSRELWHALLGHLSTQGLVRDLVVAADLSDSTTPWQIHIVALLERITKDLDENEFGKRFTLESLEGYLKDLCLELSVAKKDLFMLLRIVLTGKTTSPSLFHTMVLLGKDRCKLRLRDASQRLSTLKS